MRAWRHQLFTACCLAILCLVIGWLAGSWYASMGVDDALRALSRSWGERLRRASMDTAGVESELAQCRAALSHLEAQQAAPHVQVCPCKQVILPRAKLADVRHDWQLQGQLSCATIWTTPSLTGPDRSR